ncbi:MAG: 30S ribosomal protein S4 [Propionibacteriaceae bacterium]|jgi:small subunit ribosomal protein S4|nr:30S ribosomal protein S4 [Propionibacteriaceae bacterium]
MARYTGPLTRKSRRLGTDLVGNDKSFERRPYPPGMHGRGRTKDSEYSQQLREKQKARYAYGVLEKQFRRYYEEATRSTAKTGDILLQILESRLDNVVYRAGFANTRRQARQMVSHGHLTVNGHKVDIPSYRVSPYDIIEVRTKSADIQPFVIARELHDSRSVPAWLTATLTPMRIVVHQLPVREQIVIDLQEQLIVELYSR